jgi:hypothetical protein
MNKNNLTEQLLNEYTENLTPSESLLYRIGTYQFKKKTIIRLWPAKIAAAALVAAASLVIIFGHSENALARSIEQARLALKDARSVVMDSYIVRQTGEPYHVCRISMGNGSWRYDSYAPIRNTSILLVGGKQYYYWRSAKAITVEPMVGKDPTPFVRSGVDLGEAFLNQGSGDTKKKIASHADVNGRPTYEIVVDKSGDQQHGVLVLDKETNLPIFADITSAPERRPVRQHVDYAFNVAIDKATFDPHFGTTLPIIDLETEWARLRNQWSKPLATATWQGLTIHVRDVRINREGEVFMVISHKEKGAPETPEDQREDDFLPDSLTDGLGTTYICGATANPGGVEGDTDAIKAMQFNGETTRILCWVPVVKPARLPDSLTVECFLASRWSTGSLTGETFPGSKRIQRAVFTVKPTYGGFDGEFPDYSTPLVLDTITVQWEYQILGERGDYLLKTGDYKAALTWYRKEYEVQWRTWPSQSYRPLDSMAACFDKLGQKDKAAKARAWSAGVRQGKRPGAFE